MRAAVVPAARRRPRRQAAVSWARPAATAACATRVRRNCSQTRAAAEHVVVGEEGTVVSGVSHNSFRQRTNATSLEQSAAFLAHRISYGDTLLDTWQPLPSPLSRGYRRPCAAACRSSTRTQRSAPRQPWLLRVAPRRIPFRPGVGRVSCKCTRARAWRLRAASASLCVLCKCMPQGLAVRAAC